MERKNKMTKRKFISLVKQYNKASSQEHDSYMRRGSGGRWDWYDVRDKLEEKIDKINLEFLNTFKDLIPKKEHKDFRLSGYSTDDPEEMYYAWMEEVED